MIVDPNLLIDYKNNEIRKILDEMADNQNFYKVVDYLNYNNIDLAAIDGKAKEEECFNNVLKILVFGSTEWLILL